MISCAYEGGIAAATLLHRRGRGAAFRAGCSQPALSQQVARLEELLGVRLFERTNRSVALTEAGRVLLRELKPAIVRLERALEKAAEIGKRSKAHLAIGYIGPALHTLLPSAVGAFRASHPEVTLDLRELPSGEQVRALGAGQLDLACMGWPVGEEELGFLPLGRYPFVLAVSEDHPLAHLEEVPLRALTGETIISPAGHEPLHAQLLELARRAGAQVRVQEAFGVDAVLNLVASGMGVAFASAVLEESGRTRVVFRPFSPALPEMELGVVWRQTDVDPLVGAFLEVVLALLQEGR